MSVPNKGVFLTWDFIRDKETTMNEKLLLVEISNLTMLEHGCVAHNDHFSEIMGIKKNAVSRLISSLESKGLITSIIKKGSRNFSRKITIHNLLFDPSQNVIQPITKCDEAKGNKTTNKEPDLYSLALIESLGSIDVTWLHKFVDYRKEIKHPIKTSRALSGFVKNLHQIIDAGLTIEFAFNRMLEKEWRTLELSYFNKDEIDRNKQKIVGQYYKHGKFMGYNSKGLERYDDPRY